MPARSPDLLVPLLASGSPVTLDQLQAALGQASPRTTFRYLRQVRHLRSYNPKFRSWVAFTAVLSRADGWFGLVVGALNQAGRSPGGGFRILPPKYLGLINLSAEGTDPHESERADLAVRLSNSPW